MPRRTAPLTAADLMLSDDLILTLDDEPEPLVLPWGDVEGLEIPEIE